VHTDLFCFSFSCVFFPLILEFSMQTKPLVIALLAAMISAPLFAAQAPATKKLSAKKTAVKTTAAKSAAKLVPAYPIASTTPDLQQQTTGLAAAPDVSPDKRSAEQWVGRMTDFTKNGTAFRDPEAFIAWTNAMSSPSMVPAMAGRMVEPGNMLYSMTTLMQPATMSNMMQYMDPAMAMRWSGAMMNPMFYTRMMTNMANPAKMMGWMALPMDPKMMEVGKLAMDPNTPMKFMMAPTDPRGMALMFAPMNPQLYGSMMGGSMVGGMMKNVMPGSNWGTFMYPAQPVVSVQPPAPMEIPIDVKDPRTWSNMMNMMPGGGMGNGGGGIMGMMPMGAMMNMMPFGNAGGNANGGAAPMMQMMPMMNAMPMMNMMPFGNAATNPYLAQAGVKPAMSASAAPAAFAIQPGVPARLTLAGDTLFKSGKSSVKDLTAEGKKSVDVLVSKIKAFGAIDAIAVTGHADKMGEAVANQKLSLARAKTVAAYLKSHGVKAATLTTAGMGDTKPVVDCDMKQASPALKTCLAPNRRVEVDVTGAK
jgi:outer membrane protein OmpA-like peptidoglycan-associated protein